MAALPTALATEALEAAKNRALKLASAMAQMPAVAAVPAQLLATSAQPYAPPLTALTAKPATTHVAAAATMAPPPTAAHSASAAAASPWVRSDSVRTRAPPQMVALPRALAAVPSLLTEALAAAKTPVSKLASALAKMQAVGAVPAKPPAPPAEPDAPRVTAVAAKPATAHVATGVTVAPMMAAAAATPWVSADSVR